MVRCPMENSARGRMANAVPPTAGNGAAGVDDRFGADVERRGAVQGSNSEESRCRKGAPGYALPIGVCEI